MSDERKLLNVGVVGATGVVGETFLSMIEERAFPAGEIRLFASDNSAGKTKVCLGQERVVKVLEKNCFDGLDLVFFSSGDDISQEWGPQAVRSGAYAIDNSAAFRMSDTHILCVPEVNADLLPKAKNSKPALIANPNCSTIQLVAALSPIDKKFEITSVKVASYQSVSGAGKNGIEELITSTEKSISGEDQLTGTVFPGPIAFNCIPQIGRFDESGFCTEEVKIMKETRKILRKPKLPVSAFTVRVPTLNSHAEAVWITLKNPPKSAQEIENVLLEAPGIHLVNEARPALGLGYPTQKYSSGTDPVYVGRIHRDFDDPSTWLLWVVSDNLRKGAALNGIQIAEHIFDIK